MTIAKRISGACTVRLYDKGCKWQMGYPGHARKFTAAATDKAKRWRCYRKAVDTEEIITSSADGYIDAIAYRELPGSDGGYWEAAHYPDASQDITLSDWTEIEGTWEEIDDPDYQGTMLHQRESTVSDGALAVSEILSNFQLPANPYILLNLWRAEPPKDADRIAAEPSTIVSFGDDAQEYALVIPYGGQPAYVEAWDANAGEWNKITPLNDTKLPALEGITKGQRVWITIRVLLGKLHVAFSSGDTAGQTAVYPLPDREWTYMGVSPYYPSGWTSEPTVMGVKPGPLRVQHNAGQFALRWWPLYCMPGPQYLWYLGEVETTYTCWKTDEVPGIAGGALPDDNRLVKSVAGGSTTNADVYHYPVWHWDGDWSIESTEPVVTAYNPDAGGATEEVNTTYGWYAAITPVEYNLTGSNPEPNPAIVTGIRHYQSPVLRGLQIRAEPYVAQLTEDWPEATDISDYVTGIVVAFPDGAAGGTATINLQETTTDLTLYENQMVEIDLGYLWSDGETRIGTVFIGYIATPGGTAAPRTVTASVVAYDPVIRLRGEKAHSTEPDFQTFTPKAAVEWLLKRSGFHADQMSLLGSDTPMYLGPVGPDGSQTGGGLDADNAALTPAFGAELLASVEEFCRRDNESEWWIIPDATYKFKAYKADGQLSATDGTLYELAEDCGEAQDVTSTTRRVRGLEVENTAMDSGEYADCVIVQGVDSDGNALHQVASLPERWTDTTNDAWSGGWRHMYCETRNSVQTDGQATERADQILSKRSRQPITIRATVDVLGTVVKGDLVHVTNAAATGPAERLGIRSTTEAPKHFRVLGYEHHWDGRGTWPTTAITARSIYETD
jgi:hypothetical protein